jgi:hypothetical protein
MDQRQDTRFDPKTAAPMASSAGPFPARNPNFPAFGQAWQQIPPAFAGMPTAGMLPHHDPLIADPVLAPQPSVVGQPPFHRMDFYPAVKVEPPTVPNGQSFAVRVSWAHCNIFVSALSLIVCAAFAPPRSTNSRLSSLLFAISLLPRFLYSYLNLFYNDTGGHP